MGEEAMATTTLIRAYPGLQETEAGHKFSPLGTTDNFFIIIKIHQQRKEVFARCLDASFFA